MSDLPRYSPRQHSQIYGSIVGNLTVKGGKARTPARPTKAASPKAPQGNFVRIPLPTLPRDLPDPTYLSPSAREYVRKFSDKSPVVKDVLRSQTRRRRRQFKRDFYVEAKPGVPRRYDPRKPSGIGHVPVVKKVARDEYVHPPPHVNKKRWQPTDNFMRPPELMPQNFPSTNLETTNWIGALRSDGKKSKLRRERKGRTARPTTPPREDEEEEDDAESGDEEDSDAVSPQARENFEDPWQHLPNSSRQFDLREAAKRRAENRPSKLQLALQGRVARPNTRNGGARRASSTKNRTPGGSKRGSPSKGASRGSDRPSSARRMARSPPATATTTHIPILKIPTNVDGRWPAPVSTERHKVYKRLARFTYQPPPESPPKKPKRKKKKSPKYVVDESPPAACALALPDPEAWEDPDAWKEPEEDVRERTILKLEGADYKIELPPGFKDRRALKPAYRPEKKAEVDDVDLNATQSVFTVFDEAEARRVEIEAIDHKRRQVNEKRKKKSKVEFYVLESEKTKKYLEKAKKIDQRRKERAAAKKREAARKKRLAAERKRKQEEEARRKAEDDKIIYDPNDYIDGDDSSSDDSSDMTPEMRKLKLKFEEERKKFQSEIEKLEESRKDVMRLLRTEEQGQEELQKTRVEFEKKVSNADKAEEERHREALRQNDEEHMRNMVGDKVEQQQKENPGDDQQPESKNPAEGGPPPPPRQDRALEGVEVDSCPNKLNAPICELGSDGRCLECGAVPMMGLEEEIAAAEAATEGQTRIMEGVLVNSCPNTMGAPVCDLGEDGRCIECGALPENDDDEDDAAYCPMQIGKPVCAVGPDGSCPDCGVRKRNVRMCEGIEILSCPQTMGADVCEVGEDGRCVECGGIPIQKKPLPAANALGVPAQRASDEGDDEFELVLAEVLSSGDYCGMTMGAPHSDGPDGICTQCLLRLRPSTSVGADSDDGSTEGVGSDDEFEVEFQAFMMDPNVSAFTRKFKYMMRDGAPTPVGATAIPGSEQPEDQSADAERPADKPAEVKQPVEQPAKAEQTADQPAEQPVEQPAEAEQAVDQAAEAQQPVDQAADAEQPVEQPAEQPVEQPAEQPVEQPAEQPDEQPAEAKQPVDQAAEAEQPADQAADAEQPVEQPAEAKQPAEQPVDTEQPADQPAEQPVEQPAEAKQAMDQAAEAEQPADQAADAEQPVEQPAEAKQPADQAADAEQPAGQPTEAEQPADQTADPEQPVEPPVDTEQPAEQKAEAKQPAA